MHKERGEVYEKKLLTIVFLWNYIDGVTGCGSKNGENLSDDFGVIPDIKIEEIDWKFGNGTVRVKIMCCFNLQIIRNMRLILLN